ncbi:hypothetical protein CC1G_03844 [Coprinopsis cinerea okayama7|uniref:NYN domain-containing protein n=1 Tax=Coprinopsis cinerea (strain Okayama-7 / 130 / ATCC MYA-4618 / FGSC 9003) TaxID=240176 RepID=A8NGY1_COPC7|nr:hypothetical protein CC1G_03844 [Coprinopsis cinerea okayama7\|eukprot:XP_001833627.1 hypothetical protein CC1G_03844 [Coprinopsis cinerea okayama7\
MVTRVSVYWDASAQVALDVSALDAVSSVFDVAKAHGLIQSFRLYVDRQNSGSFTVESKSELQASGVSIVEVAAEGRAGASAKMMLADAFLHGLTCVTAFALIFVSADPDIMYGLSLLKLQGIRTILLTPRNAHRNLVQRAYCELPLLEQQDISMLPTVSVDHPGAAAAEPSTRHSQNGSIVASHLTNESISSSSSYSPSLVSQAAGDGPSHEDQQPQWKGKGKTTQFSTHACGRDTPSISRRTSVSSFYKPPTGMFERGSSPSPSPSPISQRSEFIVVNKTSEATDSPTRRVPGTPPDLSPAYEHPRLPSIPQPLSNVTTSANSAVDDAPVSAKKSLKLQTPDPESIEPVGSFTHSLNTSALKPKAIPTVSNKPRVTPLKDPKPAPGSPSAAAEKSRAPVSPIPVAASKAAPLPALVAPPLAPRPIHSAPPSSPFTFSHPVPAPVRTSFGEAPSPAQDAVGIVSRPAPKPAAVSTSRDPFTSFTQTPKPPTSSSPVSKPVPVALAKIEAGPSVSGSGMAQKIQKPPHRRYRLLIDILRESRARGETFMRRVDMFNALKRKNPNFIRDCDLADVKGPVVNYLNWAYSAGIIMSNKGDVVLHPDYY